jgi:hypothetical protein
MEKFICQGVLNLNGTNIKYSLTNNYFDSDNHPVSHLEFNSLIYQKPNAISETGYKSHFFGQTTKEITEVMKDDPEGVVKYWIENLLNKEGKKLNRLVFQELPELQPEKVTVLTLF